MGNKNKITTQVALARAIGCHPVTLSMAKNNKFYVSVETYKQLAKITGIDSQLWICGSRKKLAKELMAFFKQQKISA